MNEFMLGRYYSPFYSRDKSTLIFYTSLNDVQKAALKDGLLAGDLDKNQYLKLQDLAFDDEGGWSISWDQDKFTSADQAPDIMTMQALEEPTENFPNGVPESTKMTMTIQDGPTYFVGYKTSGGSTFSQSEDLDGIAFNIAEHELYGNEPNNWDAGLEVQWIAPGRSHKMEFQFKFSDRLGKGRSLEEASEDGNEHWTLDTLPDDIKKSLAEKVEERKRQIQSWQHDAPAPKPPQSI
jgi:hypothetical protein